jgi:hypothetical protein
MDDVEPVSKNKRLMGCRRQNRGFARVSVSSLACMLWATLILHLNTPSFKTASEPLTFQSASCPHCRRNEAAQKHQ